jgi:hypothetical protein
VAFIRHGEVIRTLELSSLEQGLVDVVIRATGFPPEACAGLSKWGKDIEMDGDHVRMTLFSEALMPEVTRYLVAQGADVYAIHPERASLEEIFIQTVGEDGGL